MNFLVTNLKISKSLVVLLLLQVSIALGLNYSENLTKTTIVPYITLRGYLQAQHRSLPMWEVEMGQAFGDEVSDYFQKFKHFKVHYVGAWRASEQYAIQRETSLKRSQKLYI